MPQAALDRGYRPTADPDHLAGFVPGRVARSAMEAGAMGLPLVLTDIRGCRQAVAHGRNSLPLPVRDAEALADAIGTLIADLRLRTSMGQAAREKALAEFDVRRQVQITLEVYRLPLGADA